MKRIAKAAAALLIVALLLPTFSAGTCCSAAGGRAQSRACCCARPAASGHAPAPRLSSPGCCRVPNPGPPQPRREAAAGAISQGRGLAAPALDPADRRPAGGSSSTAAVVSSSPAFLAPDTPLFLKNSTLRI